MAKILIADDVESERRLVQSVLEDAGHTVVAVQDGKQALEVIDDVGPDLVVLDVVMPGKSGFDVCQSDSPEQVLQQDARRTPDLQGSGKRSILGREAGRQSVPYEAVRATVIWWARFRDSSDRRGGSKRRPFARSLVRTRSFKGMRRGARSSWSVSWVRHRRVKLQTRISEFFEKSSSRPTLGWRSSRPRTSLSSGSAPSWRPKWLDSRRGWRASRSSNLRKCNARARQYSAYVRI